MWGTIIVIMVHPQAGQTRADCMLLSETKGAYSYDGFGTACWKVYGKAVQINPLEHDIEEGFRITNFNFNANGKVKPAKAITDLGGPKVLDA